MYVLKLTTERNLRWVDRQVKQTGMSISYRRLLIKTKKCDKTIEFHFEVIVLSSLFLF